MRFLGHISALGAMWLLAGLSVARPATQASQPVTAGAQIPLSEIAGVPAGTPRLHPPTIDSCPEAQKLYEIARSKLDDGRLSDAYDNVEKAIKASPQPFFETLLLKAQLLAENQQLNAAVSLAREALDLRPDSVDANFLIGGITLSMGDLETAKPHFRSATLLAEKELNNPHVTLSWFFLGQCLGGTGRLLAAAQAYERFDEAIWESNPEHRNAGKVQALLHRMPHGAVELRVELLHKLGRNADAARITTDAVQRWPDDSALARTHAKTLLAAGSAAEALRFCRERLEKADNRSAFMSLAVEAAKRAGQLDAWVAQVEKSIANGRGDEAAGEMVAALKGIGESADAIRLGQALLARPSASPDLAWDVAQTQLSADDVREAIQTLVQHVRSTPQMLELPARRFAEWTAALKGRSGVANIVAELRKAPDRDYATEFVLALCAMAIGQSDVAGELLTTCTQAKPEFAPAIALRGRMLLVAYDWPAAKANATELLKSQPNLAAAHFILAEAHDGLDENDDAEKEYKQAIRLAPTEPAYPLALGNHYLRLGDAVAAQRWYSETLTVDNRCGEAHEKLIHAYLLKEMGDLAREQFRRMQAADVSEDSLRRAGTIVRHLDALLSPAHLMELRAQLESHPDDAMTAEFLCGALLDYGRLDEAETVVQRALATAPDDEQLRTLAGRVARFRGDFDKSVEIFSALVARYPNRQLLLEHLARSCLFDFRVDEQRKTLKKLISLAKERAASHTVSLLASYVWFGEWDAAIEQIDALIKQSPASDDLFGNKLNLLVLAGKASQAFALAAERVKGGPVDPRALGTYVAIGCDAKEHDAVIKSLRTWLATAQDKAALIGLLVDTLLDAKKGEEALKLVQDFTPAGDEQGNRRRIWFATCYQALGKTNVAVEELEELLRRTRNLDPEVVNSVRRMLVNVLLDAHEYDRALEYVTRWNQPDATGEASLELMDLRRAILQAAGREDEYIDLSRRILERVKDPAMLARLSDVRIGLNNDLGYTWVDRGENLETATAMIREAVAANPLNAAYLDSYGWACYKAGDFAGAEKWLSRAIRLYGEAKRQWGATDPTQHDHLADALYRQGRKDAAAEHWSKALEFIAVEEKTGPSRPDRVKLRDAVAAKRAAIDRGEEPATAPTAAEQRKK